MLVVPELEPRVRAVTNPGAPLQALPPVERPASHHVAGYWQETGRKRTNTSMTQLFEDERCTAAILEFLATTEVGVRGRRRLMGEEDYGEEGTGGNSDETEDSNEEAQSEGWESEDEGG
jgi:hypothetical protein